MDAKECSNYRAIALISHAGKMMLKILQATLQQYVNQELQMYKLSLEKAGEPETKLPTPAGSQKKARELEKVYFCFIDYSKPLTVWITINCGKFLKRWEYPRNLYAGQEEQLVLHMEQWTGSNLEKEHSTAVYCHPAYLTYMQSPPCKMLGWMIYKLESSLPGEILTVSDMQMVPL